MLKSIGEEELEGKLKVSLKITITKKTKRAKDVAS